MLIAVLVVSLCLIAWLNFVAPNVAGIGVDGNQLVVYLTGHAGRKLMSDALGNDPYFSDLAESDDTFFHDSYVSVPVSYAVLGVTLCLVLAGLGLFGFRRMWRQTKIPI